VHKIYDAAPSHRRRPNFLLRICWSSNRTGFYPQVISINAQETMKVPLWKFLDEYAFTRTHSTHAHTHTHTHALYMYVNVFAFLHCYSQRY